MLIDEAFAKYLSEVGYHPRSDKHSDFLSQIIIAELVQDCAPIRDKAGRGELVAKLRHHQQVGHDDWVIDIAIGTCAGNPVTPPAGQLITVTAPAIIQIAIELKSIITEHGKARRNRLRDFNAFHNYAHQYSPQTIAGAFLVVNSAEYFYSPLRKPKDITKHAKDLRKAHQVAQNAVTLFRSIPLRNGPNDTPGLEAIGVIVIEHDNVAFHPEPKAYVSIHRATTVAPSPPALRVGDPMHYETMIQRLCSAYTQRFA
ncbi:MAG: hypothetical protein ACT4NU_12025 [Chromatiales bacterium]